MIKAKSLSKSFGDFKAVDEIDLHIKKGECFGLLGPNGAGKSTFIGMTYGSVLKTGGELSVFEMDPVRQSRAIKKRLGVVTQENALDESLTVFENMMIYGAFVGLPKSGMESRVDALFDYMNLSHKKHAPIRTLSGGMKRRLVFVRALLGNPELLILDEPTTGLDPAVRHLLWGKIQELREKGTSILLTTHYMHEAEVLCDRLVILNRGKVVALGTPREMIEQHAAGFVGIFKHDSKDKIQSVISGRREFQLTEDSSGINVRVRSLEELTSFHSQYGLSPQQIRPGNLEDVFIKLTGQELSVDA